MNSSIRTDFQTRVRRELAKGSQGGFTLIELLIVVLIIGVLAGIVVLAVSNSTGDARAKACTQTTSNLLAAIENYKATSTTLGGGGGSYPAAAGFTSVASPGTINGSAVPANSLYLSEEAAAAALVPNFIKELPDDYATSNSASGYLVWVTNTTNGSAFVTARSVVDGCENAGI